ncbi:MAG: hypothetical protein O9345_04320 [Burkholderiaceae bacterium]|jgi:hypothetical protein|nr:hypothetical protein [Burkholderiales bacterium]MCZ8099300.1 hypothetical protein [Burkholderiales bacterium]MCZ8337369.1 hypothetical protein [Burkholderiaceae bacterium]
MISLSKLFRRPPKPVEPDGEVAGPPEPAEESPLMLDPSERTILLTVGEDLAGKTRLPVPQLPDSVYWDLAGLHVVTPEGRRRYGHFRVIPYADVPSVDVSMKDACPPKANEFVCFTFRRIPEGAVSLDVTRRIDVQ